jgi:dienelactone hydrolase
LPQEAAVVTDEARARDFLAKLQKHDGAGAFAMMNDRMRGALPAEQLGVVWTQLEQQAGAFQQIERADVTPVKDSHVVDAHATFARAKLVLRVTIDPTGQVSGFFVKPEAPPPYDPPPYVDRGKFDEIDVMVGKLPGTLSLPKGASHVPAIVLVHGSGPNGRDEHIGALEPFHDLAWGLASRGIAVLRYDKRTKVDPTGVRTQHDEVDEAAHAAVALLAARPEVDRARVALLGHSQGGYLAPRIAADDRAIKRLVILAGSTRPLEASVVAQLRYFQTLHPDQPALADQIKKAEQLAAQVADPALKPDTEVDVLGAKLSGAYFLDVRGYHPADVAAKLAIPILVLQGERDYQVTLADDFPAWKAALGTRKTVAFHTYPLLSHAFAPAGTPPSPADYDKPGHVDPQVIADIAAFLTAP